MDFKDTRTLAKSCGYKYILSVNLWITLVVLFTLLPPSSIFVHSAESNFRNSLRSPFNDWGTINIDDNLGEGSGGWDDTLDSDEGSGESSPGGFDDTENDNKGSDRGHRPYSKPDNKPDRKPDDTSDENLEGSADSALTPCLQQLQRHQDYGSLLGTFRPHCNPDGSYAPVQCHPTTGHCWCVDSRGNEIFASRVRVPNRPNCQGTSSTESTTRRYDFGEVEKKTRPPPVYVWPVQPSTPDDIGFVDLETTTKSSRTTTTSEFIYHPSDPYSPDKLPDHKDNEDTGYGYGPGAPGYSPGYGDGLYDPSKKRPMEKDRPTIFGIFLDPLVLAGLIGGSVLALLCIILLIMFMVYRMRKKDEGSYALGEPKRAYDIRYTKTSNDEFFA